MIFQAMNSAFGYSASWLRLLAIGGKKDQAQLAAYLKDHFAGSDVRLFAKGRSALAQALAMTRPGKTAVCAFTCYSVVQAAEYAEREPVFVDVRKHSLNFSAKELVAMLKEHPDITSVVVQNTLGNTVDIRAIKKVAQQYNLLLIEDLAHCVGAHYPAGEEVGTVGDLVMLSFGREKVVDVGNGGALVVRNPDLKLPSRQTYQSPLSQQLRDRIYPLAAWHARKLWRFGVGKLLLTFLYKTRLAIRSADGPIELNRVLAGWQSRLALQALRDVTVESSRRATIAKIYKTALGTNNHAMATGESGFLRFSLFVDKRQAVLQQLAVRGFQLHDIWYDTPIGPTRYFKSVSYPEDSCPNAVWVAANILNLPTHQGISAEDAKRIADSINKEIA